LSYYSVKQVIYLFRFVVCLFRPEIVNGFSIWEGKRLDKAISWIFLATGLYIRDT